MVAAVGIWDTTLCPTAKNHKHSGASLLLWSSEEKQEDTVAYTWGQLYRTYASKGPVYPGAILPVRKLRWHPTRSILYGYGRTKIWTWELDLKRLRMKQVTTQTHPWHRFLHEIQLSRSVHSFLVKDEDDRLAVWHQHERRLQRLDRPPDDITNVVVWHPNRHFLASLHTAHELHVWDVRDGTSCAEWKTDEGSTWWHGRIWSVAFEAANPDVLAVFHGTQLSLWHWRRLHMETLTTIPTPEDEEGVYTGWLYWVSPSVLGCHFNYDEEWQFCLVTEVWTREQLTSSSESSSDDFVVHEDDLDDL